jgi:hypothetical protein
MSYNKEQWFSVAAAALFLAGAVFALINVFGGQVWAFWIALGFIIAAVITYIVVMLGTGMEQKIHRQSKGNRRRQSKSEKKRLAAFSFCNNFYFWPNFNGHRIITARVAVNIGYRKVMDWLAQNLNFETCTLFINNAAAFVHAAE